MATLSRLFSMADYAAASGLSERTVQRRVAAGEIRTVRVGRTVRIHPDEVARLTGEPVDPTPDAYREHVLALVAAAPPLTSDQAARIKAVLEAS